MKTLYAVLAAFLLFNTAYAQSDNCSAAPTLTVMASCASAVAGTSSGATQSIPGCTGTADDDVWYKFVATGSSHVITVTGSASFDPVIELFSGVCASLVSINCMDNTFAGQAETITATGLTAGTTYYLRIFNYGAGSGSSTFTTCITNPPPAPANDNCSGAINLVPNTACVNTAGTSYGGTASSITGCSGTAEDDVWFTFTANNYTQTIQVTPSANMDAVVQLFSGSCASLTSITCEDVGFTGGNEVISATGLVPGATYYLRVYDYYSTGGYPFNICVSGAAITGTTQPNDNPCSAIQLPPVTSDCNYLNFSTVGATTTSSALAPTPASCVGGSGAAIGGYTSTPSPKDVWFKITVPANGRVCITPQPNMGAGSITDGVMALYSGSCSSLTQIACSDDNAGYPGSANDALPYINQSGLTPGATLYLRYWAFGTSAPGAFGLCVQSPSNDSCVTALYICDLNGYSASTSAAFTADHNCNMRGNGEGPGPGYAYSVGANPPGPFGAGGSWGTGSASQDVTIEKNSWIRFTAASSTASLRVSVGNCWVGNYPSGGIQMQIFSATNCCNYVPVSDFKEGSSTFTVNAVGLTIGSDYYLMVDGYAADICNYTIQALTGVAFPAITAAPDSICPGGTTTLTAPAGAASYDWMPGTQTTRTITVNPGSTITYTCIVGGVCGYKQTLTKTIVVKPLPNVQINGGSPISTCGTQTITLTGSGASTYTWSGGQNTNTVSVSPSATTGYTLTGKTNGCVNTATATVTVNPIPNVTVTGNTTICYGQSTVLTGNGGTSYTWSPGGAATSITVSPTSNTSYNVTGVNAQGCTKTVATTVTVNPLPSVSSSSTTICSGKTGTLTAGGAVSYTWSTGASGASISASPAGTTNYTVTGTGANTCTNSAVGQVSVTPLPVVTASSGTICLNKTYTITAGGANVYNWSTGQSGSSISVSPTVTTTYTVTGTALSTCTNVNTATVTVLSLPQITSTPSVSPSNCGASTGSITLVSVSGAPTLTYAWMSGTVTVGSAPDLNNQPAGTYNLHVQDGNGCTNLFGPYSITNPGAPAAPTASAAPATLCQGGTIGLSANGGTGVTYNWTGPNSFATGTQNPTLSNATTNMSGVYSVFVTSAGCSGPATSVTVTVNPPPSPSANASQAAYCATDTIHLFASSASTYTWSGPGGFSSNQQNPSINNGGTGAAGIYTLTVTNSNSCSNSTTTGVTVNANPNAQASANPAAICAGNTVNLGASGGTGYSWQGPNGFSSSQQSPTIPNAGTSYAGQYTVTVTNASGCNTTTVTSVSINTVPSFTAGVNAANICYGSGIQLTAGGTYTYSWSGPGSYSSGSQNPSITPATPANSGIYTVTATNGSSCSQSQTVSVNVYAQIAVNASALSHVICQGTTASLSGSGGGTYAWAGPGGFTSGQQNPQLTNVQAGASGIYTLTVTETTGCTAGDTVKILVSPTPTLVSIAGDSTCYGGQLVLSANYGSGVSVNWYSDPALSNLLQASASSYSPTITANGTYTFYTQGTLNGCTSAVTPITAGYYNVHAVAGANVYNGAAPLSVNFNSNGSTGVTGSDQFSWIFGDGTGTSQPNPNHIFNNGGTYTVVLTVTDVESGCMDTADVLIKVDDDLVVIVPNVFTPNGDGVNDQFHLTISGAKSAEGYIYNRWGQLLFSWDALNASWDGKASDGVTCPDGTYFYLIKVVDKKDKEHLFPGYALITR